MGKYDSNMLNMIQMIVSGGNGITGYVEKHCKGRNIFVWYFIGGREGGDGQNAKIGCTILYYSSKT